MSDRLYQQLSERYQFDALEETASARFITILISLGGILLGLGIITFVSANWQQWSREVKTLLLLTLFILVNTSGFDLWRQPNNEVTSQKSEVRSDFFNEDLSFAPKIFSLNLKMQGFRPNYFDNLPNTTSKKQRLGHGLLIFGALILGANIALMAQMFHIGGSPFGLYIVWGLGVLVMAYSLQLESLGIMAILLIGLGYFMGLSSVFSSVEFSWLEAIIKYMALVAAFLLMSLAYWCSSKIIFFLATSILLLAL
ncbi:MAG: DUF2157 domain-containing protein [Okeania sp. SIO2C9]|nr:DUF2157 domain-containing protein [Okeania sp. SIO2C9]